MPMSLNVTFSATKITPAKMNTASYLIQYPIHEKIFESRRGLFTEYPLILVLLLSGRYPTFYLLFRSYEFCFFFSIWSGETWMEDVSVICSNSKETPLVRWLGFLKGKLYLINARTRKFFQFLKLINCPAFLVLSYNKSYCLAHWILLIINRINNIVLVVVHFFLSFIYI